MTDSVEIIERLYRSFNSRDVEGVLRGLSEDVRWANGMDGGYVQGHEGVREYWTRQWSLVSPQADPLTFDLAEDGTVRVEVRQIVRDLDGKPLHGQDHGLHDATLVHVFHTDQGKIARFDIEGPGHAPALDGK